TRPAGHPCLASRADTRRPACDAVLASDGASPAGLQGSRHSRGPDRLDRLIAPVRGSDPDSEPPTQRKEPLWLPQSPSRAAYPATVGTCPASPGCPCSTRCTSASTSSAPQSAWNWCSGTCWPVVSPAEASPDC